MKRTKFIISFPWAMFLGNIMMAAEFLPWVKWMTKPALWAAAQLTATAKWVKGVK